MKIFQRTHLSAIAILIGLAIATGLNAKRLEGVWKLQSGRNISYKIFKKDGHYINLRSTDNGKTFQISREGKYEILIPGIYLEHEKKIYGRVTDRDVVITYKEVNNKLVLSFKINRDNYKEEWIRSDKDPLD